MGYGCGGGSGSIVFRDNCLCNAALRNVNGQNAFGGLATSPERFVTLEGKVILSNAVFVKALGPISVRLWLKVISVKPTHP